MVAWTPNGPAAAELDGVHLVAVLPVVPLAPATEGERYNRHLLDGLVSRGLQVAVVDRAELLEAPADVLRRIAKRADRILIDAWLYRDLHDVLPGLPATVRGRITTLSHACHWKSYRGFWSRTLHRGRARQFLAAAPRRLAVGTTVLQDELGPLQHVLKDAVARPGPRGAATSPAADWSDTVQVVLDNLFPFGLTAGARA